MSVLNETIAKAERRARNIDLASLVRTAKSKTPEQLASGAALAERRRMLEQTVGPDEAIETYERIVAGDELQPINYLPRGVVAARPVCRITLSGGSGYASGFLIAPGLLLTNNHVFPTPQAARAAFAEFDVELDVFDKPMTQQNFGLRPDLLFHTSAALDYAVVAVEPASQTGVALERYGFLPLVKETGKAVEGEWLTIVQHPGGERKKICIRENKLLKRAEDVLWYATDTLGGSSGSPVFNNGWQVVALHHQGVPEKRNGRIQTIDGLDFDPSVHRDDRIKWIANEGIRISRIVDDLQATAKHELLEPVYAMTAERAQGLIDGFALDLTRQLGDWGRGAAARPDPAAAGRKPPALSSPPSPQPEKAGSAMAARTVTVTLEIDDDGQVSLRDGGAVETFVESARAPGAGRSRVEYDFEPDDDYSPGGSRGGYDAAFLQDGFEVPLPDISAIEDEALEIAAPGRNGPHVLDYHGYSLVMHAQRKFAIYTAANVSGGARFLLGRPTDRWRYDPRIPRSAQIGDYYYANNKFDRGHLTRYEDMEYGGSQAAALVSAADTLHFTNCAPQHSRFNQRREWWQGLEQHILERSVKATGDGGGFAAQVFTGPILSPGDPVWSKFRDVQYPARFWKIAVARALDPNPAPRARRGRGAGDAKPAERLFAAGFVLDQSGVIKEFGIESTVETPFTDFQLFQVPIDEIERLTGLKFAGGAGGTVASLSEADPLRPGTRARAAYQARIGLAESTGAPVLAPPGYVPLGGLEDIVGL